MKWLTVTVSGPSMVPTLRPGDELLARRGARVRPGDLVLARFADVEQVVVKRAVRPADPAGAWVLASDNEYAGGDSRTHGPGTVFAKVVWRYRPLWRRPH